MPPLIDTQNPYDVTRFTPRPIDLGALGSYVFTATTGTMSAGLSADSPIFSFRWGNAANKALIRRIRMGMASGSTGFTAGIGRFWAYFARSFSASDSGGTAITLTGNQCKKRTSFGTSLVTDARISSTGALTAGTRTLDTLPFGTHLFGVPTTTNNTILPTTDLWIPFIGDGDWPLVLSQNEGFVITATVPATGIWVAHITVNWDEVGAY